MESNCPIFRKTNGVPVMKGPLRCQQLRAPPCSVWAELSVGVLEQLVDDAVDDELDTMPPAPAQVRKWGREQCRGKVCLEADETLVLKTGPAWIFCLFRPPKEISSQKLLANDTAASKTDYKAEQCSLELPSISYHTLSLLCWHQCCIDPNVDTPECGSAAPHSTGQHFSAIRRRRASAPRGGH